MWFDVRKLLASANFQDVPDIGSTDPGGVTSATGEDFSAPGGSVPAATGGFVGGSPQTDALNLAAAPATVPDSFDPTTDAFAGITGTGADPGTAGGATTSDPTSTTTTPASPQGLTATAQNPNLTASIPGSKDQSQVTTQPTTGQTGDRLNTGGAGGAAGANAMTQLANALRGVAQAAQGGNPQAQQLMNMLRQMQQAGMMNNMMGGQGYNPYMNQQFNPWAARQRMEQMRREFMERQRLRQQLYGAGAGRPAAGSFGGRRGR